MDFQKVDFLFFFFFGGGEFLLKIKFFDLLGV